MTTNNGMDLNAVITLVDGFRDKYRPVYEGDMNQAQDEIKALVEKRDDLTYSMIAELVKMAIQLDVEAPTGGYEDFLLKRKIMAAKGSQNPYGPYIKAVLAVKNGDKWEFPDNFRSYEKHANHVRFLVDAKRKGLINGTIEDYIRNFKDATYGNKLKGIEAKDRADNPNAAQAKRVDDVRERGKKAAPKAILSETFSAQEGDVVKLWGRISSGQLEVMVASVANDDADSLYYQLGLTIPK